MSGFVRLFCLVVAVLLSSAGPAAAQLFQPNAGKNHIEAELVAETAAPAAGSEVTLAFVMKPEKGWHGYWLNPGDAGAAPRIEWSLPAGATAGPLLYPVPQTLMISGLMNYVFEGDYAQLVKLHIPPGLKPGEKLPIAAKVDHLACTDRICVPETARLTLELTIGDGHIAPEQRRIFDRYRAAMPRPLGSPASFERSGDTLRLAIPIPATLALDRPYFFTATNDALVYAAPQSFSRTGDMVIVETRASGIASPPGAIAGVLRIGDGLGLEIAARPGPVPASGNSIGDETSSIQILLVSLAGAILGGLLLNIMPCVFPILSLKALSLARSGESEAMARREALAYTAGVVATCLALGGALLALRAGGSAAGWAFQLQDPRVILFLLLLVTGITVNLAGAYELPGLTGGDGLAKRGGTAGAFWTGALAAFIATPCTGPFMGAALGAALVLPIGAALAVFAGLGLGLALPFLMIGFVPALRRRLPKPGPWMERFRHILAVPMGLTALGLIWILHRQSGTAGLLLGIAAAIVLVAGLVWVGRRQGQDRPWLPLAPALAAGLAAIALVPTTSATTSEGAGSALQAERFSEARLAELRAERRPVFVYFTADWCVTCKVNEKAVLNREEVAKALRERQVTVLVGDWTLGDPAIGRFLDSQGRSGVPLYLYYPPGGQAQVLPQILTVGTVLAAVR